MVVRHHWALAVVLLGILSGCGEPSGNVINPSTTGPPTEAQIAKMKEMMGGTVDLSKQAGKMKKTMQNPFSSRLATPTKPSP